MTCSYIIEDQGLGDEAILLYLKECQADLENLGNPTLSSSTASEPHVRSASVRVTSDTEDLRRVLDCAFHQLGGWLLVFGFYFILESLQGHEGALDSTPTLEGNGTD